MNQVVTKSTMKPQTESKTTTRSENKPAQAQSAQQAVQSGIAPGASRPRSEETKHSAEMGGRAGQPVHFELTNPSARKVCIAGTFNDWKPESTEMISLGGGKWAKDLTLPPGTYEYRLVVDGKWLPDPNAPRTVPNPFGEPNSVVTVAMQSGTQKSGNRISP
jgi:1,4-alpha-glucan branching enzyme